MHQAVAAEGRHGAAQFVRLLRCETSGNDGDLHGLLLKERHAERLAEDFLQLDRRKARLLLTASAA